MMAPIGTGRKLATKNTAPNTVATAVNASKVHQPAARTHFDDFENILDALKTEFPAFSLPAPLTNKPELFGYYPNVSASLVIGSQPLDEEWDDDPNDVEGSWMHWSSIFDKEDSAALSVPTFNDVSSVFLAPEKYVQVLLMDDDEEIILYDPLPEYAALEIVGVEAADAQHLITKKSMAHVTESLLNRVSQTVDWCSVLWNAMGIEWFVCADEVNSVIGSLTGGAQELVVLALVGEKRMSVDEVVQMLMVAC